MKHVAIFLTSCWLTLSCSGENVPPGSQPAGGAAGSGGGAGHAGSQVAGEAGKSGSGGAAYGGTSSSGGAGGDAAGAAGQSGAGAAGSGNGGVAGEAGGAAGASGTSGTSGACSLCEARGLGCCDDACKNFTNDPQNCGACGKVCPDSASVCASGECVAPQCTGTQCEAGSACCNDTCCAAGQICCAPGGGGPVRMGVEVCTDPVDGTCPVGCPLCICASPDTPIATPSGELPIAALRAGDLVYSVGPHGVVVVPVLRVNRAAVSHHTMVRLTLANGATLELSARHPTADGRTIGDLRVADQLDGVAVLAAERVPYGEPYTYDILADSPSGAYFAGGVLIGSTLNRGQ